MMAVLAFRTGRLPSEWAAELERDERAVYTVVHLIHQQDEQRRKD